MWRLLLFHNFDKTPSFVFLPRFASWDGCPGFLEIQFQLDAPKNCYPVTHLPEKKRAGITHQPPEKYSSKGSSLLKGMRTLGQVTKLQLFQRIFYWSLSFSTISRNRLGLTPVPSPDPKNMVKISDTLVKHQMSLCVRTAHFPSHQIWCLAMKLPCLEMKGV